MRSYVFPVVGSPQFGDSYGAFRGDVAGNWHHGDDIFASLGTPVVAVADGTLNRVGWEPIGGWRLWVRDTHANEFYYAHLSGYSPLALRSRRVTAGEVIGFVGNTGDAFTTPPHLHFEIHPHQLLALRYDGAVDPTRYLEQWRQLRHVEAPRPALARVPGAAAGREARFVFHELLVNRGLAPRKRIPRPRVPLAGRDVPRQPVRARRPARASSGGSAVVPGLAAACAMVVIGACARGGRRRLRLLSLRWRG
jgi:hypothetical protein